MTSFSALIRVLISCVVVLLASSCATGSQGGCKEDLKSPECRDQCAEFADCSQCAAQPSCGWCGTAPGNEGKCVPALNGEDHRSDKPDTCGQEWFYLPSKLSEPPVAPYCPPPADDE